MLTNEDREWIDARADELFREDQRSRGSVSLNTARPQDYRDYFVASATAERLAALAPAQPAPHRYKPGIHLNDQGKCVIITQCVICGGDPHTEIKPAQPAATLTPNPVDGSQTNDPAVKDEACRKCGADRERWLRCSHSVCPGGEVFGRLPSPALPAATPPLAEALAVPEVQALVEAAEDILEQIREGNEMPISTIGLASALRRIGGEG